VPFVSTWLRLSLVGNGIPLSGATHQGDVKVKKQALTTTQIETSEPATSAELDERRQPFSEDSRAYLSKPKTRQSAPLGWIIDCLAVAGGAMAGVYVGAWLESPDFDPNSVDTEAKE
jgi:hypothetical protein